MKKQSVNYYYTGGEWVISDGTYSQANTIVELTDEVIAQFTTLNIKLSWIIIMNADGNSQDAIDYFSIEYDFAGENPSYSSLTVWCNERTLVGEPNSGAPVSVRPIRYLGELANMATDYMSAEIDADGYWEMDFVYETTKPPISVLWSRNGQNFVTEFPTADSNINELTIKG